MKHFFALPLSYLLLASSALAQTPASFAPVVLYSVGAGNQPHSVAVADVDYDGKLDVMASNVVGYSASVLLGTGSGTFGAVANYNSGAMGSSYGIAVADVDNDDRLDLLLANVAQHTVSVLLGTGTGTFAGGVTYSTGASSAPYRLSVADVNGDGHRDLLTANSNTHNVGILLGNGNGTFQAVTLISTGAGSRPYGVAVADVNADGQPDVLTVNSGTHTAGVLLGNGNGTFQPMTTYSTGAGSQPSDIALADVNGDGKLDVLTANFNSNTAGVLLGNGNGTFQAATTYGAGGGPLSLAVADVNGDGKPDLLMGNRSLNTVGVLLGLGNGAFKTAVTFSTGAGSNPLGIAAADVNRDGRPDLVVGNNQNGAVGILLNTGTYLPTRAALPGTAATLAPNPATTSTTLTATGLPTGATHLTAVLLNPLGQVVRRLAVPAALGVATASVPTTGLAAGLYVLRLDAVDAQGAPLGALPTQRLSVE